MFSIAKNFSRFVGLCVSLVLAPTCLAGFSINIDYSLDTSSFFDNSTTDGAAARAALQAAADRYECILDTVLNVDLNAVPQPSGANAGTSANPYWRIGMTHPNTGMSYQISTAPSEGDDSFLLGLSSAPPVADQYNFGGLNAMQWTLFAGARSLPGATAGVGGTGTGTNLTTTFSNPNGPHHRGWIPVTSGSEVSDLPAWGGSVSFDNDGSTTWHFGLGASPSGTADFYTIALHEIGHALGLSSSWNQFEQSVSGSSYSGANALGAVNADNSSNLTSLQLEGNGDNHWKNGEHNSYIYSACSPQMAGTVGIGTLQDLVLDPESSFTTTIRRYELTNADVGALRDVWISPVPEPSAFLFLSLAAFLGGYGAKRQRWVT